MTEPSDSAQFLRWFASSVLAGVTLVVALVSLVDPYDQYRLVVSPGFNLIKPALTRYQNEIKLTRVVEVQPDVLILGNSRAEIGFDPDAPVFTRQNMSAYNLAVPGTGIANALAQVEYLHSVGFMPKIIVLSLEFLDFMEASQQNANPGPPAHLNDNSHPVTGWFWRFDSLLSLAAVSDAIHTLFIQRNDEAETITSRGFNPLKQYRPITRDKGYYRLFQQRAQENTEIYLKKAQGSLTIADFASLNSILNRAAESGSEVKLIIYPYHAQILVLFEETGLWPAFQEWKSLLVREIAAVRQQHPSARFTLFDFSGYGPYNCEKIPGKGDRQTATHWYWEAGHFKKELGDIVLESVFSYPMSVLRKTYVEADKMDSFGFRLDESDVALTLNIQRIGRERQRCMQVYPELFYESATLVGTISTRHKNEQERKLRASSDRHPP